MHLLKNNSVIKLSFPFNFTIKFTFTGLSFKIIILLAYILIILNKILIVIIKKQGLNIKVVIKNFSL